ncbi:MAG: hypothetical protein K2K79_01295 [Paramuribaculum sp.]|nr:hypothetical protein [Paramuribaculum sp.]
MKINRFSILALLSFLIGGLIYLFFRSNDLLMFDVLKSTSPCVYEKLTYLRLLCEDAKLPDFAIYNLPDGLWLISMLCAVHSIWINHLPYLCGVLCRVFTGMAICTEWMQYAGWLPGTADWMDVIAYVGALCIYKLLTNQKILSICREKLVLKQSSPWWL